MKKLWRGRAERRWDPEANTNLVESESKDAPLPEDDPVAVAQDAPEESLAGPETEGRPGWLRRMKFRIPLPDRKWNRRTITVSLDKDMAQVVVFKGKRVTGWGIADLSSYAAPANGEKPSNIPDSPGSVLQDTLAGLGIKRPGRLGRMVDKVGIRRGHVVMDLSLYTTLMRRLQIPRVRGRYLEPVVVSEVLDSLPFSKEEVDITWKLQKDEEGQSVFAIALPKERVDYQVKLVRAAGLIPAAAYSKASALALAAGVPNGIVVHQAATETALVLVHRGEPKVVHQLEFVSGGSPPEEHATALVRAIEQVAGYFQPSDPQELGLGPTLPVILTGLFSRTHPVTPSLLRKLRRRVLSIEPPIQYPADFPASEFATNVGLFLASGMGDTKRLPSVLAGALPLDLLPRRHRPRPVPVLQASIFVVLILLAIHPFNITDRVDERLQERNAIAQTLQAFQLEERQHDVLLVSHRENNRQLESVRAQTTSLETRVEQLQVEMDTLLARLFTITSEALPPGVELSGVSPLGQDFSIVGSAASHAETLQYVANLRSSPLFAEARILRVDGAGGANPSNSSRVGFQIKVSTPTEEDATIGQ